MLLRLLHSIKKSSKLKKVSTKLSAPARPQTLEDIIALVSNPEENTALNELFNIAKADRKVYALLCQYDVTNKKFEQLYSELKTIGLGQYVSGHYVAASALVFPASMQLLLDHYDFDEKRFDIHSKDNHNSRLAIATILLDYFK